ncbi:hypothetical protein L7F22_000430 [Adiantum nelumboides]|nr:hypothetical protein [Adiantum nelumboides]
MIESNRQMHEVFQGDDDDVEVELEQGKGNFSKEEDQNDEGKSRRRKEPSSPPTRRSPTTKSPPVKEKKEEMYEQEKDEGQSSKRKEPSSPPTRRFGTPLEIVSDNDPGFRRGLLTEVCEELKISHRHSTPYYPQSNGLVEKANGIIAGIIRKMVEKTLQPIELNIPTIKLTSRQEQSNDEAWIDRLLNLVELEWKREAACYKKKALQLKDKLNEGIKDKEIKEKSLVLRYNNALDNRFDAKFERRWEGPFIVKKAFTGGYYQLMDLNGKEHPRKVNGYRLKPYLSRILRAVFETKQVSKKTKKLPVKIVTTTTSFRKQTRSTKSKKPSDSEETEFDEEQTPKQPPKDVPSKFEDDDDDDEDEDDMTPLKRKGMEKNHVPRRET